jgi:hypothetical protein
MSYVLKDNEEEKKLGIERTEISVDKEMKNGVEPIKKIGNFGDLPMNNKKNKDKKLSNSKKLDLIINSISDLSKRVDKLERNHLSNIVTKEDLEIIKPRKYKRAGRPPTFEEETSPIIADYIIKKGFVLTTQLKDNFSLLEKSKYYKKFLEYCQKNNIPLVSIKIGGLKSGRPPSLLFIIDDWFKAFLKTKKNDIETRRAFTYKFEFDKKKNKDLEKKIIQHELLNRIFSVLSGNKLVKIRSLRRSRRYF